MYQYNVSLQKNKVSEQEDIQFRSSEDVAKNTFIQELFINTDNDKEKLYVIMLNVKNKIIGYSLISIGSISSSIAHPREILKPAILASATSIILLHNHPSGDPAPSTDDTGITDRMNKACNIIGINLMDHIILGFEAEEFKGYYSFKQHNII